jgi:hypothetical protein
MSVYERVYEASDPRAAMLEVAKALDRIEAKLAERETVAPGWGAWTPNNADVTVEVEVPREAWAVKPSAHAQPPERIAALEHALEQASDPETQQALAAQLRLARDEGGTIDNVGDVDTPSSFDAQYGPNNITVTLPVADERRQAARRKLAIAARIPEYLDHLDEEDALTGFARGGPLWLYLDNRDVVMQLPVHVRQAFIQDVALDSAKDAQEMARDILKSESPGDPEQAIDAIDQISEADGRRMY